MKKTLLTLLMAMAVAMVYAQKPSLVKAQTEFDAENYSAALETAISLRDAEIAKVKEKNDKLRAKGKDDKTKPEVAKGTTYEMLGKVYAKIAMSEDEALIALEDKPVAAAMENFNKVKELEKENSPTYMAVWGPAVYGTPHVDVLYSDLFNAAVNAYNAEELETSIVRFEQVVMVKPTDTAAISNAFSIARMAEDNEKVKFFGQKLIGLSYDDPSIHYVLASMEVKAENYDEALKILKDGKSKFPENADLTNLQINIYITTEKTEEAIAELKEAVDSDPENVVYNFNLAVIYDNLGKKEEALKYYEKVISLDPEYYGAHFNLGVMYYNDAVEAYKVFNELPINTRTGYPKDKAKAESLLAKVDEAYKAALPYFEKADQLKPDQQNTLELLYRMYEKLGQKDKLAAVDKKLSAITGDE